MGGGSGNDQLIGGDGSVDEMYGNGGQDSLYGGAGYDYAYGGDGNDFIDLGADGGKAGGGAGNDQLLGGDGSENLQGGGGLDSLYGSAGNDTLYGGAGNDTLSDDDESFEEPVFNPDNGHWYQYVHSYGSWTQAHDAAALSQLGALDGYLVTITSADEQAFINTAFANLYYTWSGASDADTQGTWTWETGPEAGLVFTIEGSLPTGAYNNWNHLQPVHSGPSANRVMINVYNNNAWEAVPDTDDGRAYIVEYGAPGDTTALQPPGDLLDGGAGDDSISSRGGNDSIDGGDGTDRLNLDLLTRLRQDVILELSDPTTPASLASGGSVVNIEQFSINSGRGNDSIRTGAGNDNIDGGDGNDSLYGGSGYDNLHGDAGDDLINGGLNPDNLIGGDGSDIFSYGNANEGGDVITDFNGNYDRIQVSAAGFRGGLVAGIDLLASRRYVENSTGLATSAAGIGQFIYLASSNKLYWDGDGAGGLSATLLTTFSNPVNWSASVLQVV